MEDNNKQVSKEKNPDQSKEVQPSDVVPEPQQLSYKSFSKLARILIDIARTSSLNKKDSDSDLDEDN